MQTNLTNTGLPGGEPLSKVELTFECQKLVNMDTTSKSDPQVWMYSQGTNGKWRLEGKTEVIQDNLNPKFSTSIKIGAFLSIVLQKLTDF